MADTKDSQLQDLNKFGELIIVAKKPDWFTSRIRTVDATDLVEDVNSEIESRKGCDKVEEILKNESLVVFFQDANNVFYNELINKCSFGL